MLFGARRSKLAVLADLARAIGASAFRVGDAAGMVAFDTVEREDLYVPASLSRGVGHVMAAQLENPALVEHAEAGERHRGNPVEGLLQALQRLAGRQCLVFLASDFHFPLARLDEALDTLSRAYIVPVILWDPAETEPPPANGLIALRDAETAARRTMWLRPKLREQWRDAVAERRRSSRRRLPALDRLIAEHLVEHVLGGPQQDVGRTGGLEPDVADRVEQGRMLGRPEQRGGDLGDRESLLVQRDRRDIGAALDRRPRKAGFAQQAVAGAP
eukprot:gene6161-7842_t